MKIAITGANGLLATHCILQLIEKKAAIIAIVRDASKFTITAKNMTVVEIPVFTTIALEKAFSGCDYVIHAAAATHQNGLYYSTYQNANVKLTHFVAKACIKQGIKKLLFISTANTLGYGSLQDLGDENKQMKAPFTNSFYAKSKKEAELVLKQYKQELYTVFLHPTFMLGTHDTKPSSGKIITITLGKKIIWYPSGGKNFIAAKDAAILVIKALTMGDKNEHYLLANRNMSYKDFYGMVAKTAHKKQILIPLPKIPLLFLGKIGDILRYLKIPTSLSTTNMQALCIYNYYSNVKVTKDFNMHYTPMERTVQTTWEWLYTNTDI